MNSTSKKKWIPKIILITVIIVTIILVYISVDFSNFNADSISNYIESKGHWGAIVYVIILSVLPLFLFPDSVIVIAGGMCFGLIKGSILTSIGSLIGAIIAYLLAGYLGKGFIQKFIKHENLEFTKGQSGFFLILLLRLIPLFPFKLISYSAGFAEIDLKEFSLATLIGSIPGIIVYTNLGDNVLKIGSFSFYLSIGLLIILTVLVFVLKKYLPKDFQFIKNKKEN